MGWLMFSVRDIRKSSNKAKTENQIKNKSDNKIFFVQWTCQKIMATKTVKAADVEQSVKCAPRGKTSKQFVYH